MSLDPTAPQSWELVATERDMLPAGWRRHSRDVHLELIRSWVGAPQGRWLKTDLTEERSPERALLPLGTATWIGADVARSVAREGGERTNAAVVADVRALPCRDGSFDGVLSTSTLDHFEERAQIAAALRELHRVLVRDGILLLTLDNPRNPLIRLRNALPYTVARRTGLAPFFVGATLDARDGAALLEQCGFEVREMQHVLHAPHVIGTRAARWSWVEHRALPLFDRLAATRVAPWSGHFVAFLARRR